MAVSVLMSATLFCFILGVREPPGAPPAVAVLRALRQRRPGDPDQGPDRLPPHRGGDVPLAAALQPVEAAAAALPADRRAAVPRHRRALARPGGAAQPHLGPPLSRLRAFRALHDDRRHGRPGPWWYFVPIVLLGLFPWTGFLWAALRAARCAGGWARRQGNADAWFFVTWAAFIFLFFSASHSKLPPYILPVFPAAGRADRRVARAGACATARRSCAGACAASRFVCGLLAAAAARGGARDRPASSTIPAQARALRPFACGHGGGPAASAASSRPWLGLRPAAPAGRARRLASPRWRCSTACSRWPRRTSRSPAPRSSRSSVRARRSPATGSMHYHEFFHDFTFYAAARGGRRGLQGRAGAGRRSRGAGAAAASSSEAEFRRQWAGPGGSLPWRASRTWRNFSPTRRSIIICSAQTRDHYLFSNQP